MDQYEQERSAVGNAGPSPSGSHGLSKEAMREWLERSCAAQGVPVPVIDPTVLRKVVLLLGRASSGPE